MPDAKNHTNTAIYQQYHNSDWKKCMRRTITRRMVQHIHKLFKEATIIVHFSGLLELLFWLLLQHGQQLRKVAAIIVLIARLLILLFLLLLPVHPRGRILCPCHISTHKTPNT